MKQNNVGFLLLLSILFLGHSCNQTKFPFGKRLFLNHCSDCHMDDGKGFSKLYPSLKSKSLVAKINELPCIIREGINDSTSLIKMLPMPQLSEVEITNITNYILQDLNGTAEEFYLRDIQKLLETCGSKNN